VELISGLIAGKYERGEITTYQGTGGQVFPRIDIATGELGAVRNRLSDTMVLDVARERLEAAAAAVAALETEVATSSGHGDDPNHPLRGRLGEILV
jgi:hypothetical protein